MRKRESRNLCFRVNHEGIRDENNLSLDRLAEVPFPGLCMLFARTVLRFDDAESYAVSLTQMNLKKELNCYLHGEASDRSFGPRSIPQKNFRHDRRREESERPTMHRESKFNIREYRKGHSTDESRAGGRERVRPEALGTTGLGRRLCPPGQKKKPGKGHKRQREEEI